MIRWTKSERDKILVHGVDYFLNNTNVSTLYCLQVAQYNVLEENRRRNIRSLKDAPWFKTQFIEELKKRNVPLPKDVIGNQATSTNITELYSCLNETQTTIFNAINFLTQRVNNLERSIVETIEESLNKLSIAETVGDYVENSIQNLLESVKTCVINEVGLQINSIQINNVKDQSNLIKIRRPRIMIVGLTPGEAPKVQQQFKHILDIDIWASNKHPNRQLPLSCKNKNAVYIMKNNCSHTAQELVETITDPIIVSGSITDRLIDDFKLLLFAE